MQFRENGEVSRLISSFRDALKFLNKVRPLWIVDTATSFVRRRSLSASILPDCFAIIVRRE